MLTEICMKEKRKSEIKDWITKLKAAINGLPKSDSYEVSNFSLRVKSCQLIWNILFSVARRVVAGQIGSQVPACVSMRREEEIQLQQTKID